MEMRFLLFAKANVALSPRIEDPPVIGSFVFTHNPSKQQMLILSELTMNRVLHHKNRFATSH
jgi:hypothetical protein